MKAGVYKKNLFVPFLKIISDALSIELAVLFSYYVRFYSSFTLIIPVRDNYYPSLINYFYFSIVIIVIYLFVFGISNSYRSRKFLKFSEEIPIIFKTCLIGILLSMSVAFLYRGFSYSRIVFVLIFINTNMFLLLSRMGFQIIKNHFLLKGYNLSRIYLVGSVKNISKVIRSFNSLKGHNFELKGYISEYKIDDTELTYMGQISVVSELINKYEVDGLLISLDHSEHYKLLDIMKSIEGKNVEIFYIPDILDIITSHFNSLEIAGLPVLQLKAFTISGWQGFLKRNFDIIISFFSLILLAPLFLLISILIKLIGSGPVFYRQNRVTLNFRNFIMLKFRSMYQTEESKEGLVDVEKNDPRVTPIGAILRRTSLDELPQLYNVLKGEMSLVGPRPERRYYVEKNIKEIPKYSDRQRVRCGITGWAQVNGLRSKNTSLEERVRYDLYYIENWSLWFDIKILIRTIMAIVKGENAY
jgi:exopolysaccharide biosynthesis polyprenyl glycosylphosphotransferase